MKFTLEQVPQFYQGYVSHVVDKELVTELKSSRDQFVSLCQGLSESQSLFRYAEGKWSIKDMILHLVDAERVFAYRAVRFARNDKTELSGFDQDDYANAAFADKFSLQELIDSYSNARLSTLDLYSSLSESELLRTGKSNGSEMTVEMIGFIISGHTYHHINVIKDKYL